MLPIKHRCNFHVGLSVLQISGEWALLGEQALGMLAIIAWAILNSLLCLGLLNFLFGLRVHEHEEVRGLDWVEHQYDTVRKQAADILSKVSTKIDSLQSMSCSCAI